jgi:hypothetical protein
MYLKKIEESNDYYEVKFSNEIELIDEMNQNKIKSVFC